MDMNLPLLVLVAGITGAIDPQFTAEALGLKLYSLRPDEQRLPPREQHRVATWLINEKIRQCA